MNTLGEKLGVLGSLVFALLGLGLLVSLVATFVLQTAGSDETLNLGGLGVFLAVLAGHRPTDDEFTNIVLLGQTEKLTDVVGTLRSVTFWLGRVGEARDLVVTLLDNDQGYHSDIGAKDGTVNTLPLALTVAAGAVVLGVFVEKKAHTAREENTRLCGKALLVVKTSDLQNVAGEVRGDKFSLDLLSDAAVVECTHIALEFEELLRAQRWVGNIELHPVGR